MNKILYFIGRETFWGFSLAVKTLETNKLEEPEVGAVRIEVSAPLEATPLAAIALGIGYLLKGVIT